MPNLINDHALFASSETRAGRVRDTSGTRSRRVQDVFEMRAGRVRDASQTRLIVTLDLSCTVVTIQAGHVVNTLP